MHLPDHEVRMKILAVLDEAYEREFDAPLSPDQIADNLILERPTVDLHLRALQGKKLVKITGEATGGHYYVTLTPLGKDEWDRRRGNQHHLVLRRRILEWLKALDDQEPGQFSASEALVEELKAGRNHIFINLFALKEKDQVDLTEMMGGTPYCLVRLTPAGRAAVEEPSVDIDFCFVVMPFESAFDDLYEQAIRPAAEDVGMTCARADKVRDNRTVVDKIKRSIQRAGIIVANMTGNNPNVFYEIGYAHGLGKECILITQTKSEEVPFDLRHLEHIRYVVGEQGLANLRSALKDMILGVRGRGI